MGLGEWFKDQPVIVQTSFSPPVDVARLTRGASAASQGAPGGDLSMKILRPKVIVAGVEYAPYGEPLPLWQIGLVVLAIVVLKRLT